MARVTRRPRRTDLTPAQADRREQIRQDVQAPSWQPVPREDPVPAGHIRLATRHRATDVRIRDIETVERLGTPNTLGLRGVVVLLDGTRHLVPDPDVVVTALRAARSG